MGRGAKNGVGVGCKIATGSLVQPLRRALSAIDSLIAGNERQKSAIGFAKLTCSGREGSEDVFRHSLNRRAIRANQALKPTRFYSLVP